MSPRSHTQQDFLLSQKLPAAFLVCLKMTAPACMRRGYFGTDRRAPNLGADCGMGFCLIPICSSYTCPSCRVQELDNIDFINKESCP